MSVLLCEYMFVCICVCVSVVCVCYVCESVSFFFSFLPPPFFLMDGWEMVMGVRKGEEVGWSIIVCLFI